eukprot:scaffold1869_cov493-Prasinococcus_capsulatus_cf.AAC.7
MFDGERQDVQEVHKSTGQTTHGGRLYKGAQALLLSPGTGARGRLRGYAAAESIRGHIGWACFAARLSPQASGLKSLPSLLQSLPEWTADTGATQQFRQAYDSALEDACGKVGEMLERCCNKHAPWFQDITIQTQGDAGKVLLAPTKATTDLLQAVFDYRKWIPQRELQQMMNADRRDLSENLASAEEILGKRARALNYSWNTLALKRLENSRTGATHLVAPSGDAATDAAHLLATGQLFDGESGMTVGLLMGGQKLDDSPDGQANTGAYGWHARMIQQARADLCGEAPDDYLGIGHGFEHELRGRCVSSTTSYLRGPDSYALSVASATPLINVSVQALLETAFVGATAPCLFQTGLSPVVDVDMIKQVKHCRRRCWRCSTLSAPLGWHAPEAPVTCRALAVGSGAEAPWQPAQGEPFPARRWMH